MRADERDRQGFDERLLGALRDMIVARTRQESPAGTRRRPTAWKWRVLIPVPGVVAVAVVAVLALGSGASAPPAFAVSRSANGTVTVTIDSFQNPTRLEQGLANAGIHTMIQLLPDGKDCSAPQHWTPVAMSSFPSTFDTTTNPQADSPIDSGGVAGSPLTLILRYVPPGATLVIQSMRSGQLQPDNPKNTYMLAISGPGRGMRIFWEQGQVKPCTVVGTSSAS